MGSSAPLGKKDLFATPGTSLPPYVREVARSLMKKRGMDKSRAIATAIAVIKRWASGAGDVDPDTRAKAAAAVAQWEAAKSKAHATPNKGEK